MQNVQNSAAAPAPAQQAEVINLSSANTSQASTYQPEQFDDLASAFSEQWVAAATADSESVEISRLDDLMETVKKLVETIKLRQDELSAKAKEKQAAGKLKELLESGVTDPVKLREAIDAMQPARTKSAPRSPYAKAAKVHENLAVPDHNDFKWGYTDSLRNLDSSNPGQEWAKKRPDGSADPSAFRKATADETAKMQFRRDADIAAIDAKRAEKKS